VTRAHAVRFHVADRVHEVLGRGEAGGGAEVARLDPESGEVDLRPPPELRVDEDEDDDRRLDELRARGVDGDLVEQREEELGAALRGQSEAQLGALPQAADVALGGIRVAHRRVLRIQIRGCVHPGGVAREEGQRLGTHSGPRVELLPPAGEGANHTGRRLTMEEADAQSEDDGFPAQLWVVGVRELREQTQGSVHVSLRCLRAGAQQPRPRSVLSSGQSGEDLCGGAEATGSQRGTGGLLRTRGTDAYARAQLPTGGAGRRRGAVGGSAEVPADLVPEPDRLSRRDVLGDECLDELRTDAQAALGGVGVDLDAQELLLAQSGETVRADPVDHSGLRQRSGEGEEHEVVDRLLGHRPQDASLLLHQRAAQRLPVVGPVPHPLCAVQDTGAQRGTEEDGDERAVASGRGSCGEDERRPGCGAQDARQVFGQCRVFESEQLVRAQASGVHERLERLRHIVQHAREHHDERPIPCGEVGYGSQ
jgi:hypothetical protein